LGAVAFADNIRPGSGQEDSKDSVDAGLSNTIRDILDSGDSEPVFGGVREDERGAPALSGIDAIYRIGERDMLWMEREYPKADWKVLEEKEVEEGRCGGCLRL
jgi:hypothetical protein